MSQAEWEETHRAGPPSERRRGHSCRDCPQCATRKNEGSEEVWEIESQLVKRDNLGLQASFGASQWSLVNGANTVLIQALKTWL